MQGPVGWGAAPSIESAFNQDETEAGIPTPIADTITAAEYSRTMRSASMKSYAGWAVAALLALAVIGLLIRG